MNQKIATLWPQFSFQSNEKINNEINQSILLSFQKCQESLLLGSLACVGAPRLRVIQGLEGRAGEHMERRDRDGAQVGVASRQNGP